MVQSELSTIAICFGLLVQTRSFCRPATSVMANGILRNNILSSLTIRCRHLDSLTPAFPVSYITNGEANP